jgi:hypothetical protein
VEQITVVGGGLAGLIAATEVAEAGVPVKLVEARTRLGGRARSIAGPYQANLGPHALYAGTVLWDWLDRRGLAEPTRRPSVFDDVRFRWNGELRRTPPAAALRILTALRRPAPVDRDFRGWMTDIAGPVAAQVACGAAGPLAFDHDAGRLSAAFVAERIKRILLHVRPVARYVIGGWGALVDRMETHARFAGVEIVTGTRLPDLDDVARRGPVVVALDPASARALLDDDTLRPVAPRVALLDLGLEKRRRDPYLVVDLDEAAFVDRFTAVVPSLAPDGHELVQASVGLRPGEGLESGVARLEAIVDLAFPGWRERTAWQRRGLVTESTGALELPGTTWRDRTPVAYQDGIWLAGDWVAAPGHLAEVACTSAVEAARAAVASLPTREWAANPGVRTGHEQVIAGPNRS